MRIDGFYWRLAVFTDPAADVPSFAQTFNDHTKLRQELIFVHGLERSYVEHGIAIANSAPVTDVKKGVGFEFCKTRIIRGNAFTADQEQISWIAQITKVREGHL